ncbi:MAG: hypothetical protein IMZ60_02010 [Actinobacteria bacterium]|nr:hypothetical protein [Actinomycetota bacterium]
MDTKLKTAEDKILKAKIKLQSKSPFFSYLSYFLKIRKAREKELPQSFSMGVDITGNIFYNPEWIVSLTDDEVMGVLTHEICLTPDTNVGTKDLLIEEISDKDMAICSDGDEYKIQATSERKYKGDLMIIKARGMLPLKITPNHPVHTLKMLGWKTIEKSKKDRKNIRQLSNREWVESGKLTKENYLIMPKIKENIKYKNYKLNFKKYSLGNNWSRKIPDEVRLNKEVAEILGLFLANGWTSKTHNGYEVGFCFNKAREDLANKTIKIMDKYLKIKGRKMFHKEKGEGVWRVIVGNRILKEFLREEIGTYSHNKIIPEFIVYNPDIEICKGFLKGMYACDGWLSHHEKESYNSIYYATTSKQMALQLQKILSRFNCFGRITEREGKDVIIFGKLFTKKEDTHNQFIIICNEKPLFDVLNFKYKKVRTTKWYIDLGDSFATKIISIKKINYEGLVYNLQTKLENYTANNILVHNCHLAFLHLLRRNNRNKTKWNIVTDLVSNSMLIKNGFSLPKCGLIPDYNDDYEFPANVFGKKIKVKEVNKKTAEDLFNELPEMKEGDDEGSCGGWDIHMEGEGEGEGDKDGKGKGKGRQLTPAELKDLEEKWRDRIEEALMSSRARGNVPVGMERIFEQIRKSQIGWRVILERVIQKAIPTDVSWMKRSKKSVACGVYLPSVLKERVDVVISIDTSGSIGQKELTDFVSEVIGMARAFQNHINMRLITHDCEVQNDYEIRNGDIAKIKQIKIKGGGGTSHEPVFDYIKEKVKGCKTLIAFTDGYSDLNNFEWDNHKYPFEKIFVLNKEGTDEQMKDKPCKIIQMKE